MLDRLTEQRNDKMEGWMDEKLSTYYTSQWIPMVDRQTDRIYGWIGRQIVGESETIGLLSVFSSTGWYNLSRHGNSQFVKMTDMTELCRTKKSERDTELIITLLHLFT